MSPEKARLFVHGDNAMCKFRQETLNYFLEGLGKKKKCKSNLSSYHFRMRQKINKV